MNLLGGHHHHHHHHHQQQHHHQANQLHQLQQRQYHHYHMQIKESSQSGSSSDQQHSHAPTVFQYQPSSQVSASPTGHHQWYYNSMGHHYAHQNAQGQQVQQYIQQADYAGAGLLVASQTNVKGETRDSRANSASGQIQASPQQHQHQQHQQQAYSVAQHQNQSIQEQQLEFHWMASPRRLADAETLAGGGVESGWH